MDAARGVLDLPSLALFPVPDEQHLKARYVGRTLDDHEVPAPSAVVDLAVAERHCGLMLNATEKLGLGFRAHVKTHKTTQLTRLQVGTTSTEVKLIVSTLAEAEHLVPLLLEYRRSGRNVNILYGLPLPPSQARRLATVARILGPGSVAVHIDHVDQLPALEIFKETAGFAVQVFVKLDTGYHRAGVSVESTELKALLQHMAEIEATTRSLDFLGFYSHAGDSYGGSRAADAMRRLAEEIQDSALAAEEITGTLFEKKQLILSVGATPTSTSILNLLESSSGTEARQLNDVISAAKQSYSLELHAGVYPLLDLQQVSTHARALRSDDPDQLWTYHEDIGLTILVEISSLYPERNPPQALIAAGCLALGREPCKSYPGWGVVAPWGLDLRQPHARHWIVGKVSQEHGILTNSELSPGRSDIGLQVGQKIRILPNHACVAGAGHGFYLVVDGSKNPNTIVDVWVRWRGW